MDLDVRPFFDSVPHDLLLKAVAHQTDERWILVSIEWWLNRVVAEARRRMPDGIVESRENETTQRSAT